MSKNSHTARPQIVTATTTALAKSITTSDEFKIGFPSDGLSTISNKWWGSGFPDSYEGVGGGESAEKEGGEEEKEKNVGPQGTGLLMDVRRRAAEEGRERLKLGVVRGLTAKKLGKRDRALLLRIFKSFTPQEWISS